MKRRDLDVYETPPKLARKVCEWLKAEVIPAPQVIWEPHSGTGSFVRAAREIWPEAHIVAFDIRPEVEARARAAGANEFICVDWLSSGRFCLPRQPHLIVGNPPFRGIQHHAVMAVDRILPGRGVSCLLGSCNLFWPTGPKESFWEVEGLERVKPFYPRPDFIGRGGCDAVGVAAFCWRRGYVGPVEFCRPSRWRGHNERTQRMLFPVDGAA